MTLNQAQTLLATIEDHYRMIGSIDRAHEVVELRAFIKRLSKENESVTITTK